MRYYVIKTGPQKGIYKTWDSCKKEIKNEKNIIYHVFDNYEAAHAYLENKYEIRIYISAKQIDSKIIYSAVIYQNESIYGVIRPTEMAVSIYIGEYLAILEISNYFILNKNVHSILIYTSNPMSTNISCGKWKAKTEKDKIYFDTLKELKKKCFFIFQEKSTDAGHKMADILLEHHGQNIGTVRFANKKEVHMLKSNILSSHRYTELLSIKNMALAKDVYAYKEYRLHYLIPPNTVPSYYIFNDKKINITSWVEFYKYIIDDIYALKKESMVKIVFDEKLNGKRYPHFSKNKGNLKTSYQIQNSYPPLYTELQLSTNTMRSKIILLCDSLKIDAYKIIVGAKNDRF